MSHVMKVCLSCYLVLLSFDSKTRKQDMHTFVTWPISLNIFKIVHHIDGLMQERHKSIANSLDLCLSYIKPSICEDPFLHCFPLFHVYISSRNCNKKSCVTVTLALGWISYHCLTLEWREKRCASRHQYFMLDSYFVMRFLLISKSLTDNKQSFGQVMAWCQTGDQPLSEPMMAGLLIPICVNWPGWDMYHCVLPIGCHMYMHIYITYMM